MATENGLPQYVSRHGTTGAYRYYRRPPTGVAGRAFTRAFGSKDRKAVMQQYAAIHAEAFDGPHDAPWSAAAFADLLDQPGVNLRPELRRRPLHAGDGYSLAAAGCRRRW